MIAYETHRQKNSPFLSKSNSTLLFIREFYTCVEMNRKMVLLGCVAVMIALAGCASGGGSTNAEQATETEVDTIHTKWADEEVGVTCYIYEHSGYAGGSIECLPMDDQDNTSSLNLGDSPTQTTINDIVRTIYPEETNVCYTYEHSGYAGGDTTCLDFSETNIET